MHHVRRVASTAQVLSIPAFVAAPGNNISHEALGDGIGFYVPGCQGF
jgi:hypothetical protein